MTRHFTRADSISALGSPAFLSGVLGHVASVDREPLQTIGFSGTQFERWQVTMGDGERTSLVLKQVDPRQDGTVWRTGNIGSREARLLGERSLDRVWDVFESPYLAYAIEGDLSALLMRDLTPHLFPDVRLPISVEQEEALVDSFARLHATFWEHSACAVPWLSKDYYVFGFMSPAELALEQAAGRTLPIFAASLKGWTLAFEMLPPRLVEFLQRPPREIARVADGLPRTIFHGDAKVGNFAVLPDGRVSAFDWATIGEGCAAADIGFYLAVSATRLTRTKEQFFARYRERLEYHLGRALPGAMWDQMYAATILIGATVLLWSKAANVQKGLAGADAEWRWWVEQLEACAPS